MTQILKKSIERRLKSTLQRGKLTPEEAAVTGPRTWYLPHFPVLNPNKPGKVRIVFDATAEYGGTSLNNNLMQGPDCINNLVGVLLRFRQDHTAIVADIESLFHQVKVREQDQDFSGGMGAPTNTRKSM